MTYSSSASGRSYRGRLRGPGAAADWPSLEDFQEGQSRLGSSLEMRQSRKLGRISSSILYADEPSMLGRQGLRDGLYARCPQALGSARQSRYITDKRHRECAVDVRAMTSRSKWRFRIKASAGLKRIGREQSLRCPSANDGGVCRHAPL